jgi:hypothetical protein
MRQHPLAGPFAALLISTCACAERPSSRAVAPAEVALATEQASQQAVAVLAPKVRSGLVELEVSTAGDVSRLHVPSLGGVEVDRALDALASAVEGRPPDSGLDLAGRLLLARVRAHRLQSKTPGLSWGGGFRVAQLPSGPSPAAQAASSLRAVEESLLAVQTELANAGRRPMSQTAAR